MFKNNLTDILNSDNQDLVLYSGTFNPCHNWHFQVIRDAVKEQKFVIINPCDRNQEKINSNSPLEARKKWLYLWLLEYWLDNMPLVILDDILYRTKPWSLDKKLYELNGRVSKIIGPDKNQEAHPYPLIIWWDRVIGRSSSNIKRILKWWGSIEPLLEFMPRSVIKDIEVNQHTFR